MSGIVGVFNLDERPVEAHDLDRMVACLAHRGPDGAGAWTERGIGLGNALFAVTPQARREVVPLVWQGGEFVLTADARIDNRAELISALGSSGRPTETITDVELILRAYLKWGEACPEKLIGDFAFALWDRNRARLFLARDPMGIKPLYYYASRAAFIFGSEIHPLFCLPQIPRRHNELRIADHLTLNTEDRRSTFYQDIFQLPAAHSLSVDNQGLRLHRYWDLDPRREIRLASEDEYAEALLEVFTVAVRSRLRSASPVGALLSGGLDSSAIVAVARRIRAANGRQPLPSFSAVFPTLAETYPRIDERPWIEAVVAQGGLLPYFVPADRLNPLEALELTPDEPLAVPNLWLNWGCFKAAHEMGIRVVLSGVDGDTALSYGHGYLAELGARLQWRTLLGEARALAERRRQPLRRVLRDDLLAHLLPPAVWRWGRILRRLQPEPSPLPFDLPIDPEFARRTGIIERARHMQRPEWHPLNPARQLHRQALLSGMVLYMPELIDKLAAATGVEARLPFFDRRLLEFVVAVPTGLKLRQGCNRFLMRRSMAGILPESVQWRTDKGDLRPNIRRGLLEQRAILDRVLRQDAARLEPYMDLPRLHASYEQFVANPMESCEGDIFSLVIAFTLAQWLRREELAAVQMSTHL